MTGLAEREDRIGAPSAFSRTKRRPLRPADVPWQSPPAPWVKDDAVSRRAVRRVKEARHRATVKPLDGRHIFLS